MTRFTKILVKFSLLIDTVFFHINICLYYAKKLWSFLIHGTTTWMFMCWKLVVFTCVLMPGWYSLVSYWLFSPLIVRGIEYGKGVAFRNVLDVYLPAPLNQSDRDMGCGRRYNGNDGGVPVVVLVSGGAWIIGYKLWSALIARAISYLGIVVVVPDYRNFPQGGTVYQLVWYCLYYHMYHVHKQYPMRRYSRYD